MAGGGAQPRAGSPKTRTILENGPVAMANGGAQPRASLPKARTILGNILVAMVHTASAADSLLRAGHCTSRQTANICKPNPRNLIYKIFKQQKLAQAIVSAYTELGRLFEFISLFNVFHLKAFCPVFSIILLNFHI